MARPAVFLSASVPLPARDPKYFATADVIAIRDSVLALAHVIAERGVLVFGGHPAITPLIRLALVTASAAVNKRFVLYQSEFFRLDYPPENAEFESVVRTPSIAGDRDRSLFEMRTQMLSAYPYDLGVFIGGMEGVEIEFEMFSKLHPHATLMPLASTGAAARMVFDHGRFSKDLKDDYVYGALFRRYFDTLQIK
jgi:hypothetical protein